MAVNSLTADLVNSANGGRAITRTDVTAIKSGLDVVDIGGAKMEPSQSTTIPLAQGESFESPWIERTGPEMLIAAASDMDFEFEAQFSVDGENVDSVIKYNFTLGSSNIPKRLVIARQFYRVIVKNTASSDMGFLRFQVSVGKFDNLTFRLNGKPEADADALLTLSVQAGRNPNGEFDLQKVGGTIAAGSSRTALGANEVFDSGILDLTTYQSIASILKTDQDGVLEGFWYSDKEGTNIIRTFTAPFSASAGEVVQGTFKIADYFRLKFTNGNVAQTVFDLSLQVFTGPIGGQVSSLEAFLPTNIVTPIERSVIVGKTPEGRYENVNITSGGALETSSFGGYEFIGESQTDQILGQGQMRDRVDRIVVIPLSKTPGPVSLKDGDGASWEIYSGIGNLLSISNLSPVTIELGINSKIGGWSITTGANIQAIAVGDF